MPHSDTVTRRLPSTATDPTLTLVQLRIKRRRHWASTPTPAPSQLPSSSSTQPPASMPSTHSARPRRVQRQRRHRLTLATRLPSVPRPSRTNVHSTEPDPSPPIPYAEYHEPTTLRMLRGSWCPP